MKIYKCPEITLYTSYDYPPIPYRGMDWSCIDSEYDGATDAGRQIVGVGRTEQEAINNYFEEEENV